MRLSRAGLSRTVQLLLAATALALAAAGRAGIAAAAEALAGAAAPDFVLKSAGGSNIRLSEYRGEVVLLSFWATWCGDCRAQLDALADARDVYGSAGLALLAVNLDRDDMTARKAAADMSAAFPVLHDQGGEVGRLYDVGTLPTAILIDRDGRVRKVFEGYRRGDERLYAEETERLLREY
ncbi:MAG: redoxin domain-containing protein [Gammaproteobacteria bacterium]|nr:redoxin domain-containing protein [Gammaproteobacteria bacterium]